MVLSQTDVINLALAKLGSNPITSVGDPTRQAKLASIWFPAALQSMLRQHPWNFARRWQPLAMSAATPVMMSVSPDPHSNSEIIFTSQYPLPADCVRVHRAAPFQYNFRIVGRFLYTDAPSGAVSSSAFVGAQPGVGLPPLNSTINPNMVGIEYVTSNADFSAYDSLFLEALAIKLAGHLAYPLTGNLQLKQSCEAEAKALSQEAWYADGAENWNDSLYDNILTDVRAQSGGSNG